MKQYKIMLSCKNQRDQSVMDMLDEIESDVKYLHISDLKFPFAEVAIMEVEDHQDHDFQTFCEIAVADVQASIDAQGKGRKQILAFNDETGKWASISENGDIFFG